MGFRYQRRINLGRGLGINISKSGISSTFRTKFGSIGTKGFSLRTGIPGLTFRSGRGKSKGDDLIILFLLIAVVITGIAVIYMVIKFIIWLVMKVSQFFKELREERYPIESIREIERKEEMEQIVKETKEPEFINEPHKPLQEPKQVIESDRLTLIDKDDELYPEALTIVKEAQYASISYIQRRLRIRYNRAMRIMERMEKEGIIRRVGNNKWELAAEVDSGMEQKS